MNNQKIQNVYLRCEDNAEMVVFSEYRWENDEDEIDYEFTIEDSYCGGDYMGITGRFKRAWKAFWAKPIFYTGIYCEDKEHVKRFLKDCLNLIEKNED